MLRAVLLCNMDVSFSSSSSVEVLSFHTGSQRYLWDRYLVLALRSFDSWRADVGNASSSSAESSIVVITNNSFADNFAITIASWVLVSCGEGRVKCWNGIRSAVNANVAGSCGLYISLEPDGRSGKLLTSTAVADLCAVSGAHRCSIEVFKSQEFVVRISRFLNISSEQKKD